MRYEIISQTCHDDDLMGGFNTFFFLSLFFSNQITTEGNTSNLKVKNVTPSDAVVYSAKAENVAGVAKCSANLVVDCK